MNDIPHNALVQDPQFWMTPEEEQEWIRKEQPEREIQRLKRQIADLHVLHQKQRKKDLAREKRKQQNAHQAMLRAVKKRHRELAAAGKLKKKAKIFAVNHFYTGDSPSLLPLWKPTFFIRQMTLCERWKRTNFDSILI